MRAVRPDSMTIAHGTRVLTASDGANSLERHECNYLDARKAHASCWSPHSLMLCVLFVKHAIIILFVFSDSISSDISVAYAYPRALLTCGLILIVFLLGDMPTAWDDRK
jgi:hypothetical protein